MARVAALLVSLAALVLVVGCGGQDTTSPTAETVIGTVPTETGSGGGGGGGGTAEGDAAAGKEVYASAGCGSCHALSDAGSTGTIGPNLDDSSVDFNAAVEQITNGGGGMPPFSGELTEKQIADVAAYVVTARG
jgi:mono/diheme cytochrome c family protein